MKLLGMTFLIALMGQALAQTPFTYSGRLADPGTGKSTTGSVDLIIRLYTDNNAVCSRNYNSVDVDRGRFSLIIDFTTVDCGGQTLIQRLDTAVTSGHSIQMEVQDITSGITHPRTPLGATPIAAVALSQKINPGQIIMSNFKGVPTCGQYETLAVNGLGFDCVPSPGQGTVTSVSAGTGVTGGPYTVSGAFSLDVTYMNTLVQNYNTDSFTNNLDINGFRVVDVGDAVGPMDATNSRTVQNIITTEGNNYLKDLVIQDNAGGSITINNGDTLNIIGSATPPAITTTLVGNNLTISIAGFGNGDIEQINAGSGIVVGGVPLVTPQLSLDTTYMDARYANIDGTNTNFSADLRMGPDPFTVPTSNTLLNVLAPLLPLDMASKAYVDGRVTTYAGDITEVVAGEGLIGGATSGTANLDIVAGYGLIANPNDLAVDDAVIQRRVSGVCSIGSSIREIRQDGTVICEYDDGAIAGDIEEVNGSTGINVIAPLGPSPTINLDTAFWDNRYFNANAVGGDSMEITGYLDMNTLLINNIPDPTAPSEMVNLNYITNEIATNAGDITGISAGNGFNGGGLTGNIAFDIGAGPGVFVAPDYISLDISYLDPFYLRESGGTLAGPLNAGGNTFVNVPTPLAATDMANRAYADSTLDSTTTTITAITAGAGLTGASLGAGTAVINAIGGAGITVNADDIGITPQGVTNTNFNGIAGNCAPSEVLKADGAGGFTCQPEDDGTYIAGPGLQFVGNEMQIDPAAVFIPGVTVAGGDLNGTFPNPAVDRIQGRDVSAALPADGQVLSWNNGGTTWEGQADDDTLYSADATSITLTGTTFSIANNAISSAEIANNTIVAADIAPGAVNPSKFTGPFVDNTNDFANTLCLNGEVFIKSGGSWTCGSENDTVYTGGSGIDITGTIVSIANDGIVSSMIDNGTIDTNDILDGDIVAADFTNNFIDATTDFANTLCTDYDHLRKNAGVWACQNDALIHTGSLGIIVTPAGPVAAPTSATVEVDPVWWDARYVNITGDTMTGSLEVVSLFRTSDRRLKKDIQPINQPLYVLKNLNGYRFDWKKDNSADIGFIAQEVEAIEPSLVQTNEKGFKSVLYANIVAIAIEGLKELSKKVDSFADMMSDSNEQERKIASLEKRNELLKKKMNMMNKRMENQKRILAEIDHE